MKKIVLSIFALACSGSSLFSQVVLQENFTSPFNVTAAGWGTLNLSTTIGSIPSWIQGVGNNFPAFNGAANDYYAGHFNNVSSAGGDISNWLFTPVMTIQDGAVLQFATRGAGTRPDRLQVRFSTAGASTAIPPGPANVGTYTNLMLDINPLYSLSGASAVVSGSVNGYPEAWTIYTVQVTGVPVATTGRFAFRYYVQTGGLPGPNSNFIGIDAVKYTLPCLLPTVQNYTVCANTSATLTAMNGLPATTFSWSTGTNGPSTVVNPASTTVYSVYPIANGVSCGTFTTATITTGANLSVDIVASSTNVCQGGSAVLTAVSAATGYMWNNFQTTQSITVTPTASGQYSVGVSNGGCFGGNTININVLPTPTLNYSTIYSSGTLGGCRGSSFTVTATGAAVYGYDFDFGSAVANPIAINISSVATAGVESFTIIGLGANGCVSAILANYTVVASPTIATSGATLVCANKSVSLTATGATSYTWTNGTTATSANPYTVAVGATAGTRNYTVTGRSAAGCTNTAVKSVNVSLCTGIENIFGDVADMAVFPNPFTSELKVTGFNGKVEIYNALGQVVYGTTVNETETINTADLAKGVYMLKSYDNQGKEVKTIKLVKN